MTATSHLFLCRDHIPTAAACLQAEKKGRGRRGSARMHYTDTHFFFAPGGVVYRYSWTTQIDVSPRTRGRTVFRIAVTVRCAGRVVAMLRSPREEYETLERLKEPACLDFGSRILRFPFALTFYTFPKNRYADVLPYEQTRVRLERLPEMEDSDYINANYITDGLSVHIATQAPLPSTICDFWRMVFQENSPVVVMLTDFVEDGVPKADIYWPDTPGSAMRVVGNLFVSLLKTERLGSMTLRTLLLSTGSHQEARLIYHVQQHGWRDFAAPSSVQEMGALLHLVDQCAAAGLTQELDGPIVVHCRYVFPHPPYPTPTT